MLNKNKSIFLIYLFVPLFFQFSTINSSTLPKEFTNQLKRSFDTTKTISLEFGLFVLQNMYEICTAIEKIDPKIASQLGVQCQQCHYKLSCAEFSGCLLGNNSKDEVENFKKLLSNPSTQVINPFMLKLANEQKMMCAPCGKFICWVELDKKPS